MRDINTFEYLLFDHNYMSAIETYKNATYTRQRHK